MARFVVTLHALGYLSQLGPFHDHGSKWTVFGQNDP